MKPKKLRSTAAVILTIFAGCNDARARVEMPEFDPDKIGTKAVELYDANGDDGLSATEREHAPSLESAMSRIDVDSDGELSATEIASRIRFYEKHRAGLVPVDCRLLRAGRPVSGARVIYKPEEFMGESLIPAHGTTNDEGIAVISIAEEYLPSPAFSGVRPGFYRVRVTLADGMEVTKLSAGAECAGGMFNSHRFTLP